MKQLRAVAILIASLAVLLSWPQEASAQYVFSDYAGTVWRKTYTLANGEYLQLQTQGCSGSEDTAMFLLEGTGADRITRGFNDDQGSGFTEPFCSYIFFQNTSGSTKTYEAIATIHPGSIVATVNIQSWRSSTGWFTEASNVNLRGVVGKIWATGTVTHETVGRVPGAAGGWADSVLYLIDTNLGATSKFDDDSGLGPLSRITANLPCTQSYNCWIVGGLYSQGGTTNKYEVWGRAGTDTDGDGIQDGIENVRGTRPDLADTDSDGLSDFEELIGVPAASLGGFDSSVILPWEDTGAHPTGQDLFVELDYMTAADHNHNPALSTNWSNIASEMQSIFSFDSSFTARTVWTHVVVSDSMPETTYLSFGNCSSADTTKFYDRKNDVGYFNPLKAGIYHYAIWGHLHKFSDCTVSSWIGEGELWGNDLISALGSQTGQVGSTTLQRVNYVHELGHNLSLTHNGNDGTGRSCVHASVMNYRYSNGGWNSSLLRGSGYSNGTCTAVAGCGNTCGANRCVPSNQTSPKLGCSPNNGSCDCDKSEWSVANLDIPASTLMSFGNSSGNDNQLAAEEVRNFFLTGDRGSPSRRTLAKRRKELLAQRGLVEGADFRINPDNGRAYAVE